MTVHDRIRLIDRLREGPATAGLFYWPRGELNAPKPSVHMAADHTVIVDARAIGDLLLSVKSEGDRKAFVAAIAKLQSLGEQLTPPHMKPLAGHRAAGLRELRPRQGNLDWRALYARIGEATYIILAVGRHGEFDKPVDRAGQRLAEVRARVG